MNANSWLPDWAQKISNATTSPATPFGVDELLAVKKQLDGVQPAKADLDAAATKLLKALEMIPTTTEEVRAFEEKLAAEFNALSPEEQAERKAAQERAMAKGWEKLKLLLERDARRMKARLHRCPDCEGAMADLKGIAWECVQCEKRVLNAVLEKGDVK